MAKQRIQRIEILALRDEEKALIEALQQAGAVELNTTSAHGWREKGQDQESGKAERRARTAEQAAAILQALRPKRRGALLQETWRLSKREAEGMRRHLGLWERQCREIVQAQARLEELKAEQTRLLALEAQLAPWTALEAPLGGRTTHDTICMVGTVPGQNDEQTLVEQLYREKPLLEALAVCAAVQSSAATMAAICCLRQNKEELEQALQAIGFVPCPFTGAQSARQRLDKLALERSAVEDESQQLAGLLKGLAAHPEPVYFAADAFLAQWQQAKARQRLMTSDATVYVSGYVPAARAQALAESLRQRFTAAVELHEPELDEDVPVLLKNNRFVRPVESITRMYALPGPRDIDPSGVMAFFYYLFFGMMLSDAGYGLVMLLGTSWALAKLKLSDGMRQTLRMFRYCGISTVFWGVLFGSWFGDIVQVVGREFWGIQVPSLAVWFEPIRDPIKLLLFSFALGLIHLCVGLAARFAVLWKQRRRADAVLDVVPVLLLVLGAAPLAAGILTPVPPRIAQVGQACALLGAMLLLLTSGRSAGNLFAKLGGGIYGLYNTASGYLSDVLSYSRLLALGLATGSIASVVNMMGAMPENLAIKAILLTVVFFVGHAVNLAINLLGAYVHTNRLQFVELFSKFYEGGGRPFEAFTVPHNYTQIEEE